MKSVNASQIPLPGSARSLDRLWHSWLKSRKCAHALSPPIDQVHRGQSRVNLFYLPFPVLLAVPRVPSDSVDAICQQLLV